MDKKTLHVKAITEIQEDKIIAIASEEVEDREGEILAIDGWDLKAFRKNPQLLWYHNIRPERSLPIGKVKNIKIQEIKNKKKLIFEPLFEEITEFGRTVKEFFEKGFLNAFSVGFVPLEREGNKYLKQELLEISAVPVPALSSALVIERAAKAGLNDTCVKALLGDDKALEKVMTDGKDGLDGGNLNKSEETKSAVPYKSHSPAPESQAWDSRGAEARVKKWAGGPDKEKIDWGKYKQAFTWYKSEDIESFGSYKLPHHDISGEGMVTIWRGVAAAMAALLGARGGVDIPDDDKKAVYNHLKKHYGQFEKEAPEYRAVENQVLKGLDTTLETYSDSESYAKLFRLFKNVRKEVRRAMQPKKKKIEEKTFGDKELIEMLKLLTQTVSMALRKAKIIDSNRKEVK